MARMIDADKLLDDITAAEEHGGMGAVIAGTLRRYVMRQPTLTPPNEPLTIEQLRASPHGKIKDSTLQSICNRANEIACRPPEGEEDT